MSQVSLSADSLYGGGAAAAPGAGGSVCALSISTPGVYEVEVTVALTGTTETALNNGRLNIPGATASVTAVPTVTGTTIQFRIPKVRIPVTSGSPSLLSFTAGVAATAGSVYSVFLVANRIA
jgi:hypothetical protein